MPVIPKTIHVIESKVNPVTLCTGEVYVRPEVPEGGLVALCSVCLNEIYHPTKAHEPLKFIPKIGTFDA